MAYLLQMDGIDDYLKLPSMSFTEILLDLSVEPVSGATRMYVDARPGIGFTYFQADSNGTTDGASGFTVYVNSIQKTSGTTMVPRNERCIVRLTRSVGTDDLNIFSNNGSNGAFMKGKLYDVKIYNGTTLQAHYDMTTQTVQDQSGNSRHATLTGGTWVDDGVGGDTGTDGTISLSLTQKIYNDSFSPLSLYQAIYKDVFSTLSLIQNIYKDSFNDLGLTQRIYKEGESLLNLIQQFYDDAETFITLSLTQNIYKDSSVDLSLLQKVYKDTQSNLTLLQRMYTTGEINLDLLISIRDDLVVFEKIVRKTLEINRERKTSLEINRSHRSTLNI